MRDNSNSFEGSFTEVGFNPTTGVTIDRRTPSVRATYALSGVLSVSGKIKGQKLKLINRPHRYVKDVNNSISGSQSQVKELANGTFTYTKAGDFGTDGSLFAFTDKQSYNDALGKLGDVIRGGIDLSIDAFQVGKTIELAKRILSVRKIVQYLAEKTWKDTSRELRRTSTLARNRAYAYKRDRRDSFKAKDQSFSNPMKDVGGLYLEFTYGLKPTMQTIFDLVNGEAVRCGNSLNIKRKGSRFNGVTGRYKERLTSIGSNGHQFFNDVYEGSYRTKMGGTYLPSNSYIESLSRLTSLNPASILWELLPFSFVVDWFYDVGGYLRMAETSLVSNLGTFDGYVSTTHKNSKILSTTGVGTDSGGYLHSGNITGDTAKYTFSRSVLTSIPFPRPPNFRADLGSTRMINAAALLSQFLGRK